MARSGPGEVIRFQHPGAGRKKALSQPKGRQVLPQAKHEIETLLGDRPRDRQYTIEYLHLIQDRWHQISAAHLAALADELGMAFAEVFEIATFYAHFDVIKEGEPDLPPLTIRVCDSITCALFGAESLLAELQQRRGGGHAGRARPRGPRALRWPVPSGAGRRGRPQLPSSRRRGRGEGRRRRR